MASWQYVMTRHEGVAYQTPISLKIKEKTEKSPTHQNNLTLN